MSRGIAHQAELREVAAALSGRGARRARQAVGLADPRAESQPESRLRVGLALAGLRPVGQYVVKAEDGRFIARVDLAFPEAKIAIEYDGAWHATAAQLRKDRRRLNALVAAGWRVLHVTAADMCDLPRVVQSVRDLVASANSHEVGAIRSVEGPTSVQSGRRGASGRG
jgi:very-short-patch-repair endonuclease